MASVAGTLEEMLKTLAADWGLGVGLAIVVLTIAVRAALMPLTWTLAYRSVLRQAKLATLEPHLKIIRRCYNKDPWAQLRTTRKLYRQHGLSIVDGKMLLGACVQIPVFCWLYQTLIDGTGAAPFLWISNLGHPDALLATSAALTTAAAIAAAPSMSEHMRLPIIVLPGIFCFIAALHFSSAIALYLTTTNLFSAAQMLAVRQTLSMRRGMRRPNR